MRKILFILLLILIHFYSRAQVEVQLEPTDLKQQTIVTEPLTLYKGFFQAGLDGSYVAIDKHFTDQSKKVAFESNGWDRTWFVESSFRYGITDKLQVGIDIPFNSDLIFTSFRAEYPGANIDSVFAGKQSGNGIGDMAISAAYQLFSSESSGSSLALFAYFDAPTGRKNPTNIIDSYNYTLPTGSGEPDLYMQAKFKQIHFPYSYSFTLAYKYHFGGSKIFQPGEAEKKFKSGNMIYLNGTYIFNLNEWIALQNGIDWFLLGKDEIDGIKEEQSKWLLNYTPQLLFQIKRLRIGESVNIPVTGKLSGANIYYIFIAQYKI